MAVRIGSYILGRPIGRGGNASVYVARQETRVGVSRLVALKILNHGPSQSSFRREAQLATRLEHPNIIRTYDVGEHDGQMYLAMELLLGASLSKVRTPLALPLFVRIFVDIARAVHHAHELQSEEGAPLGLVHQDLTPENVMLGYDGRVTLLDFGVARLVAIDASRTDTVRGKPAYLSPEQLEGANIDRRTDVFALGALAFAMLTGKALFLRDSVAATYRAILLEPVPDLNSLRPDVPLAMASAIHRALTRDRDARWATAADLAGAIEEAARGAKIERADDATLAEFVAHVVPPTTSLTELGAEIGRDVATTGDEPAATVKGAIGAPGRTERIPLATHDDHEEPVVPITRFSRVGAAIAAGVVVIGALLLVRNCRPSAGPQVSNVADASPSVASAAPPDAAAPNVVASASAAPVVTPPPPASAASARIVRGRLGRDRRPGAPPPANDPAPAEPVVATADPPEPPHGGFLNVWANVWGQVEVDGKAVGDSPLNHMSVSSGAHKVKVSTTRGEQTRTVSVGPDQEIRERFTF